MSQKERVMEHLRTCGGLTSAEAMEMYGIARLASRVAELRADGIQIRTETVTKRNRYGQPVTFARYVLDKNGKGEQE